MKPEIRALMLGLAAALIGLPLMGWGYFLTHMVPDGHTDFRANYSAGYMLRTGRPLYDYAAELETQNQAVSREEVALPFIHPAYEALLYVPLSLFPYIQAYWLWFGINLIGLALAYHLLREELNPLRAVAPWFPIGVFGAYLPFGATLVQGQDSLLLLLILAVVFSSSRSGQRMFVAGVCLGLASFRFQIVAPIVLCLLIWRRWKLVLGFTVSALPAAVISILLAGFWPYVHTLEGLSTHAIAALHQPISKMPNLRGLIESAGGGGGAWVLIASLFVISLTLLAGKGLNTSQQFALAIPAAVLVSYHALVHDLCVLFIPAAMLSARQAKTGLVVAGVVLSTPILLIFAPNHFYLASLGVLLLLAYFVASPELGRTGTRLLFRTLLSRSPL